jgi:hypothetical protein
MPNFLSAAWCVEAFHRLGVLDVKSLNLVDALFLLDGERRERNKKKIKIISMGEGCSPRAELVLLTVL